MERPDLEASKEILRIYLNADLPIDAGEIERCGSAEAARDSLVEQTTAALFARGEENKFLDVTLRSGRQESLYSGDLVSGAVIDNIVQRAKESAIKRAIADHDDDAGIRLEDLTMALAQEYRENEIFPPTDSVEDWLKLLDYDPDNVVRVAPVRRQSEAQGAFSSAHVI